MIASTLVLLQCHVQSCRAKSLQEKQQELQEFREKQQEHAVDTTKKTAALQQQLEAAEKLNNDEQVKAAAELQEAQTQVHLV